MVGTKGPSSQNMLFPFATNMLRIIPLDWKERICMRFELHGCIVGLKGMHNENVMNFAIWTKFQQTFRD